MNLKAKKKKKGKKLKMVQLKIEFDECESYQNFIKNFLWKGKGLKVEPDEIMSDVVSKAWEEKKWWKNRRKMKVRES